MDKLAYSLALSDYYFDRKQLDEMSKTIISGESIKLDPDSRKKMIEHNKETGFMENLIKLNEA